MAEVWRGNRLDPTFTDSSGSYALPLRRGAKQEVVVSLPGYRTLHYPVETPPEEDTLYAIDPPMAFLRDVGLWMFVTDSHTKEGISGVEITVVDVGNGNRGLINDRSDSIGNYRNLLHDVSLRDSLVYRVKLNRAGYFPKKGLFLYVIPDSGEIPMHYLMDISMDPITVGSDAANGLDLRPIQFEVGLAELTAQAQEELDKVVALMKDNPDLCVDLRGHTDSRGPAQKNQRLSTERSEKAAKYIISKGIPAKRLRNRGYGESALLNKCTDDVHCTGEGHQQNRRTEFIITRM